MKIAQTEVILKELVREDADWRWARGAVARNTVLSSN